ncbi:MAG: sugar ABC transporter permease [bacterium]|nr:sugar ABC transporter permease [Candidatus Sumerlaeota bacterium]
MPTSKTLYRWSGYLFMLPYLLAFAAFLVAPLLFGIGLSFYRWEMLSPVPPQWHGLGNYSEALTDTYFWKAVWATLRFVIMQVPLNIGLALLIALAVNEIPRGAQAFFRASFFFPTIVSISVAGILWRWFYSSEFGLFNAFLSPFGWKAPWITDPAWAMKSIVMMTLWWTVGGAFVILLAGLHQIPAHYYEAAAIDGANVFQRFINVTIPSLRPVLLFVVVMNIIGSFQVFGQTFMITRGGPEHSTRSLVQYIYDQAFGNYRMGYGAAMSWLLFVIIAVISFAQFRIMREER